MIALQGMIARGIKRGRGAIPWLVRFFSAAPDHRAKRQRTESLPEEIETGEAATIWASHDLRPGKRNANVSDHPHSRRFPAMARDVSKSYGGQTSGEEIGRLCRRQGVRFPTSIYNRVIAESIAAIPFPLGRMQPPGHLH